ncbi:MAG: XRE family transcriptional regulator [Chloroflexota bacterium]|nr:MAG: XRE family transcriptional regulator [Chloroflexota bacterium]
MERGLSQGQLAERAGTGHSQIGRVESGQYATSVETLKRIAAALDADLEITLVPRSGGVGTVGVAS